MVERFKSEESDEPEEKYAPGPEKFVAFVPLGLYVECINEMELDGPPANMDEDMLSIAAARAHDMAAEIEPNTEELERLIIDWLDNELDSVEVEVMPRIGDIELQKVE